MGVDNPSRSSRKHAPVSLAVAGRAMIVAGLVIAIKFMLLTPSRALTTPDEIAAAIELRDSLTNRSSDWHSALKTWTCPTDPQSSDVPCDVCSNDWSGNWEHLHCRGFTGPYGEGSVGEKDGLITTAHITDVNLDGPVPREFCLLKHLREFDLDGGQLTGPFPRWFLEPFKDEVRTVNNTYEQCLPNVQEMDFSYNRLTGTIPPEISRKRHLQEFKVENNYLSGTIPSTFGDIPQLFRIRFQHNKLHGKIPQSLQKLNGTLNEIWLDNNDFEGDLSALANLKLVWALDTMEGVWDCIDKSRAMQDPSTQTEPKPGGTIDASRLWEKQQQHTGYKAAEKDDVNQ